MNDEPRLRPGDGDDRAAEGLRADRHAPDRLRGDPLTGDPGADDRLSGDLLAAGGLTTDPLAERVRGALSAAQRAPIPTDLVRLTMAAVRDERQARPGHPVAALAALAACLLVAVGFAAGVVRLPSPDPADRPARLPATFRTAGPTLAGPATVAPTPAAPTPAGPTPAGPPVSDMLNFPETILGLPVIDTVSAGALAGSADSPPAGPLAVRGFLSRINVLGALCRDQPDLPLLEHPFSCSGFYMMLSGTVPAVPGDVAPSGAWIHLWTYAPMDQSFAQIPDSVPAVVLGHYADPRAADCTATARDACAREFVVDAVPWINGLPAETPTFVEARGAVEVDTAALTRLSASVVPDGQVFGITIAAPGRLADLDPVFHGVTPPNVVGLAKIVRMVTPTGYASVLIDGETPTAYRSGPAFPLSIGGQPVLAVSEALAARDATTSSGPFQVAVRGWLSEAPPLPCPAPPSPPPLLIGTCPETFDALTERRQILWSAGGETAPWPDNASLSPRFLSVERLFDPRLATYSADPLAVVFLGHFHDPGAAACDAAERDACRQAFVVDRVAWVDPPTAPAASPAPSPSPAVTPLSVTGTVNNCGTEGGCAWFADLLLPDGTHTKVRFAATYRGATLALEAPGLPAALAPGAYSIEMTAHLMSDVIVNGQPPQDMGVAATCSADFDVASGQIAAIIAVVFNGSTCDITIARPIVQFRLP